MKHIAKVAISGIVSTILGAAVSQAAQVVVVDPGQTGLAGGWDITAPAGIVVVAYPTSATTLTIEKFAEFSSVTPAAITFTPVASADPQIDLVTEMLTNESGSSWSGFTFSLSGGGATFDSIGHAFIPAPNPNPADAYTTISFSPTSVNYGGRQDNTFTSAWGGNDGSDLLIDTAGLTFQFIETPSSGAVPVPLPSAALQALVGLGGLGLLASARSLKRRLLG